MVATGEFLTGLEPDFIFGKRGQADYLSTREIEEFPSTEIVDEVEDVRERFDAQTPLIQGQIEAVGPLPFDFQEIFAEAVSEAVPGCRPSLVKVISIPGSRSDDPLQSGDVRQVIYMAPEDVVAQVRHQASDSNSHLVNGIFRKFLVAKNKYQRVSEEEKEFWMS